MTVAPFAPEGGDKLPIAGLVTVKVILELLVIELTTTVTGPVVTLLGATAVMVVLVQLVTAAATPLKLTVLLPWVSPKFVPLMLTEVPGRPVFDDKLVMLGVGITVKLTGLLPIVPTCTYTFPVHAVEGTATVIEVSVQLSGVTET
jgi:hypothetical protein